MDLLVDIALVVGLVVLILGGVLVAMLAATCVALFAWFLFDLARGRA